MSAKERGREGKRRPLLWIAKFLVANALACVVFSLVGAVYYYGGQGVDAPIADETLDRAEPNSLICRFDEGRCVARLDANGYNNAYYRDFDRELTDVDVLTLGSSHMEAYQLPERANFVYLLNERFANDASTRSFYNSGRSGHPFSVRVARYEEALKLFKPKKYAIFEVFSVPTAAEIDRVFDEGVRNRTAGVSSTLRWALAVVRGLPWARLKLLNLKEALAPPASVATAPTLDENSPEALAAKELEKQKLEASWTRLVRKISDLSREYGVTPIAYFHASSKLQKDGSCAPNWDPENLAAFRAVCEREGVVFVDATERFRVEYETNDVWPYGFCNAGVVSGHMNRDGHRILADLLEETIRRLDAEKANGAESEARQ